ncbi:sulfurtransferase [Paenibacillus sp. N1-5-1-14]|uniref:sulfurtransferase n=1 Tax=Paenibacillus radicibacter TaxID=2972488 RepID=UPI002158E3D7|nr:sulfurtransferase [Paenibacillus radicibacter]MCR8642593.1 sulfurtransferase [Paenibacillus radicibacter]
MTAIVSQEWLKERLGDDKYMIIDCRFQLGQGNTEAGRKAYEQDHIPGAFHVDLEKNMSGTIREHGGRHPLPDLGEFSLCVGDLGVDSTRTVVAYDDQGGAMASRLWWMLKFLNHQEVYVLDSGYSTWKAAGNPVTSEIPVAEKRVFSPRVQRQMLASMEEVRDNLGSADRVLIDSREAGRYAGEMEPIDSKAGHIPGAKNFFWKDALDPDGNWLSPGQQRERLEVLPRDKDIIVYCGSGVTACPNVLALHEAGYEQVKLYAGSWSDWISYEDNLIATGVE